MLLHTVLGTGGCRCEQAKPKSVPCGADVSSQERTVNMINKKLRRMLGMGTLSRLMKGGCAGGLLN